MLISAAAFELTEEAFRSAGGVAATLGLLAGSLAFFVGDWFIDAAGGHRRKSPVHGGSGGGGRVPLERARVAVGEHRPQGLRSVAAVVLWLWALVTVTATVSSLAGYVILAGASDGTVAFIQTFAAGAILTMLADTVIPEAVQFAGRLVGLVTVAGFALAFLLSATS